MYLFYTYLKILVFLFSSVATSHLVLAWNLIILPGREGNFLSDNKSTAFVMPSDVFNSSVGN